MNEKVVKWLRVHLHATNRTIAQAGKIRANLAQLKVYETCKFLFRLQSKQEERKKHDLFIILLVYTIHCLVMDSRLGHIVQASNIKDNESVKVFSA